MIKFRSTYLSVLLSASLVCAPLSFVSCAPNGLLSTSTVTPLQQAISDASAVVQGVTDSYAAIKMLYPTLISPNVDAQVQATLAAMPGLLANLSTAGDPVTNASNLRGIESAVNQVLNTVAGIVAKVPGIPPGVLLGLQAAAVLVPILEQAANRLLPNVASHVGTPPARFKSELTVSQARAALKR